jgi:hypothetical protein
MSSVYAVSVDGVFYAVRHSPLGPPVADNVVFLAGARTAVTGIHLQRWDAVAQAYTPFPLWPTHLWWLRLLVAAHHRTRGTRWERSARFDVTGDVCLAWLGETGPRARAAFFADPTAVAVTAVLRRTEHGRSLLPHARRLFAWARTEAPQLLLACYGGAGGSVDVHYGVESTAACLRRFLAAPDARPYAWTYHQVRGIVLRRSGGRLDELLAAVEPSVTVAPLVPIAPPVTVVPEVIARAAVKLYPSLDSSLFVRTELPVEDEERFSVAATPREEPWRAALAALCGLVLGRGARVLVLDADVAARRAAYAAVRLRAVFLAPDRETAWNLERELGVEARVVGMTSEFASVETPPPSPSPSPPAAAGGTGSDDRDVIIVDGMHVLGATQQVRVLQTLWQHTKKTDDRGPPPATGGTPSRRRRRPPSDVPRAALTVVLAGDRAGRSDPTAVEDPWSMVAAALEALGLAAAGGVDWFVRATTHPKRTAVLTGGRMTTAPTVIQPAKAVAVHGGGLRVHYLCERNARFIESVFRHRRWPAFPGDAMFLVSHLGDLREAKRYFADAPADGRTPLPTAVLRDGSLAFEGETVRCVLLSPALERQGAEVYRLYRIATDRKSGDGTAATLLLFPCPPGENDDPIKVKPTDLRMGFVSTQFGLLADALNLRFENRPVVVLLSAGSFQRSRHAAFQSVVYTAAHLAPTVTLVSNDPLFGEGEDRWAAPFRSDVRPDCPPLWASLVAPLAGAKRGMKSS